MIPCRMDDREEEAIDTLVLYTIAHGYGHNSGPPVARLPRAIGERVGPNTYTGCCMEIGPIYVTKFCVFKGMRSLLL